MGKQITYYIDHSEFLILAQAALDAGCSILRKENTPEPAVPTRDLSAIDPSHPQWIFVLPGAPELEFGRDIAGNYFLRREGPIETMLIETGFSVLNNKGVWRESHLWIPTTALLDHALVPRPEASTRIYDKLARVVRKLAPTRSFTLPSGRVLKLHVSPVIHEKTGGDYSTLMEIHSMLHPLTADERMAAIQQLTSALPASSFVVYPGSRQDGNK